MMTTVMNWLFFTEPPLPTCGYVNWWCCATRGPFGARGGTSGFTEKTKLGGAASTSAIALNQMHTASCIKTTRLEGQGAAIPQTTPKTRHEKTRRLYMKFILFKSNGPRELSITLMQRATKKSRKSYEFISNIHFGGFICCYVRPVGHDKKGKKSNKKTKSLPKATTTKNSCSPCRCAGSDGCRQRRSRHAPSRSGSS